MTVICDTETVRTNERFDYWPDVVCRNYVPATSDNRSEGPFDAGLITNGAPSRSALLTLGEAVASCPGRASRLAVPSKHRPGSLNRSMSS